jgi:hypothetical protein
MLFRKGICLLLSHLPTSHTIVRAVRHIAVSRFYTLWCVVSCFQLFIRVRHFYPIVGFRHIVAESELLADICNKSLFQ